MKRALILSASFGGGHNKAAVNLKNKLEANGFEVDVVDILKELSKKMDNMMIEGYLAVINKTPDLYGMFYKATNASQYPSFLSKPFLTLLSSKIIPILEEKKPDVIIGTHIFAIGIFEHLKSKEIYNVPCISIITDFITHKMYFSSYVDYYIVGSEYTKNKMIAQGISKEKIFPYGIPISEEFKKIKYPKKEGFNILTMFGALGLDDFSEHIIPILEIANDVNITMICGQNEVLKEKLLQKYSLFVKNNRLNVIGYTNEISKLMDEHQLLISKPGGLSVTEAMIKELPIIVPFYIPGQEEENKEFIVEEEIGIYAEDSDKLLKEIKKFYKNRRKLAYMASNMHELSKTFSIDNIIQLIINITN